MGSQLEAHKTMGMVGGIGEGERIFCLRVDVDTVRDTESLDTILEDLDRASVKATFFVTTGRDDSARHPPPLRNILRGRYWRRYGPRSLEHLVTTPDVESSFKDWRSIISEGHELALHGFHHSRWIARAGSWKDDELEENVSEGLRRFMRSFAFSPLGFASPGFKAHPHLPETLLQAGFKYVSDGVEQEPPSALVERRGAQLFSMPVTCRSVEELILDGWSTDQALRHAESELHRSLAGFGYACYYLHPSFAKHVDRTHLKSVLKHVEREGNVEMATMVEAYTLFSGQRRCGM